MIIGTLLIPSVIWQYLILKEKGLVLILNLSFRLDEPFGVEEFFAYENIRLSSGARAYTIHEHICK